MIGTPGDEGKITMFFGGRWTSMRPGGDLAGRYVACCDPDSWSTCLVRFRDSRLVEEDGDNSSLLLKNI